MVATLTGARFRAMRTTKTRAPSELVYRNALARIAPPEGAASDLGARLPELAAPFAADAAPDPSAGLLLLDTTARRIAFDALAGFAGADGALDGDRLAAEGRLAPSARPAFERMLMALEEDEAVLRDAGGPARLAGEAPYPPLNALTEALFAEAPRRIVEISRLLALPASLPRLLADGPAEAEGSAALTASQLRLAASGPAGEARWTALARVLEAAAGAAPEGARLDVLIVGAATARLLDFAAGSARVSAVHGGGPGPAAGAVAEGGGPGAGGRELRGAGGSARGGELRPDPAGRRAAPAEPGRRSRTCAGGSRPAAGSRRPRKGRGWLRI